MLEARPETWPSAVSTLDDPSSADERPSALRPPRQADAEAAPRSAGESSVLRLEQVNADEVDALVSGYGARLVKIDPGREIPGSYWGESEAGLIENDVFVRSDTPVHSLLHELGHFICMDSGRRSRLVTDAGGDDTEECAVCYLQVLLADEITGFGRERCLADMDAWGYSFREGSAARWLTSDGEEARRWLVDHGLVDSSGAPTFQLRS